MFLCLLQLPFLLRTNLTAKATNSIAKATNSIANGTNSIATATNSIANGTNSIATATNSIANGTNSIAKSLNSIAKTCKIFTINLPSQPFLGRHLGFHIFFHHSLSEGRTLFLQLGCFGLDFISFCICIPQSWPMASFGTFLTYVFFLYYKKKKR